MTPWRWLARQFARSRPDELPDHDRIYTVCYPDRRDVCLIWHFADRADALRLYVALCEQMRDGHVALEIVCAGTTPPHPLRWSEDVAGHA
jgi:hypothetical protein